MTLKELRELFGPAVQRWEGWKVFWELLQLGATVRCFAGRPPICAKRMLLAIGQTKANY